MSETLDRAAYAVLIPAYKPDEKLVELVSTLRKEGFPVLLVNDGSGEAYDDIFTQCKALDVQIEVHPQNHGKGCALKTGLAFIQKNWPHIKGVVTADADGQHTPVDIQRVAERMAEFPDALVLGVRAFVGDVPFKSRAGNAITRFVYKLATGIAIYDTQTGLRGIPAITIPQMLDIQGDRYEYEMNMLLNIKEMHLPVEQVPIETVYLDQNASSHFNPLRDAARIYFTILRFAFSSFACFLIDYGLYLLCHYVFHFPVSVSYILARVVSSFVNYLLNKKAVFKVDGERRASLLRYYTLALAQATIGALLTAELSNLDIFNPAFIKVPVDILLFFVSYDLQKNWVFKKRREVPEVEN